jgi:hypothetical protein
MKCLMKMTMSHQKMMKGNHLPNQMNNEDEYEDGEFFKIT